MPIFVLSFLILLGLNISAMAQTGIESDVDMRKFVLSNGEFYEVEFEFGGTALKDAQWILINVPNGNREIIKNTLGINNFQLIASDMSFDEFKIRFPEGEYSIILFPQQFGGLKVNLTHNFPRTPVITYPADGATGVPVPLTITWDPLSGINELELEIEPGVGEGLSVESALSTNATSFTVPSGMLNSNTKYRLCLAAEIDDGIGNDLETSRCIFFTTGK